MSNIHKNLADGRFAQMSLCEQMANIGSEVERALNWQEKNNVDYSQKAFERALDLIEITMAGTKDFSRLKELSRTREALNDYFKGDNQFLSTNASWRKYFLHFACATRKSY
jgi:hypothetical protein